MSSPILVTGIHNSGTTWVGRILALSDEVGYIYEPFNPQWKTPGIQGARFEQYYTYITDQNAHHFEAGIRKTLAFRYNWLQALREVRDPRWKGRLRSATKSWLYYRRCRSQKRAPLLKDPIALLSAEWLAQRFGMQVIVLIRQHSHVVSKRKAGGNRSHLSCASRF